MSTAKLFEVIERHLGVSFGKYKGQPIKVMQADKPYMAWLATQDWAIEKHPHFFGIKFCKMCDRRLDDPEDPQSLDCGGDCLGCVNEVEEWAAKGSLRG